MTTKTDPSNLALIAKLLKVIDAKEAQIVCYRLGRVPSLALWEKLDRAKQVVAEAKKALTQPKGGPT